LGINELKKSRQTALGMPRFLVHPESVYLE
jgi:hypothetical protein